MTPSLEVVFFPKALRDLEGMEAKAVRQALSDLRLLTSPPWPPGKVKKLSGTELWEVKTGDYRSLFLRDAHRVVVARVVDRRDLDRSVRRFDVRFVMAWVRRLQREE